MITPGADLIPALPTSAAAGSRIPVQMLGLPSKAAVASLNAVQSHGLFQPKAAVASMNAVQWHGPFLSVDMSWSMTTLPPKLSLFSREKGSINDRPAPLQAATV